MKVAVSTTGAPILYHLQNGRAPKQKLHRFSTSTESKRGHTAQKSHHQACSERWTHRALQRERPPCSKNRPEEGREGCSRRR